MDYCTFSDKVAVGSSEAQKHRQIDIPFVLQLVLVAMALWLQDSIMVILQLLFLAFTKRGLVVVHVFRCNDRALCIEQGTLVLVTDRNQDNGTDFVLSRAFMAMENKNMARYILKLGVRDNQHCGHHVGPIPLPGTSSNQGSSAAGNGPDDGGYVEENQEEAAE
ncbi:Uncharacterized protein Fot_50833 [Forsythia ovata]|uniref:Uncharacterized protein n=1 Tax=Forsythia ovata TaxID=205694 RepID=A0ABD1PZB0_9LAMI